MLSSTFRQLCLNSKLVISREYPGILALTKWSNTEGRRGYAKASIGGIAGLGKKKLGKAGPTIEKKVLPVETDPVKLVTHCCGLNIRKEGEEVKLREDSEYPDWLWTLDTGLLPKPLEELDPDTEEYWERAKKLSLKRNSKMLKLRRF